jgi:hypothetical protein
LRGSVSGAAGTRYFEPDGVFFGHHSKKQTGNAGEAVFLALRKNPETAIKQGAAGFNEGAAMNAIVADILERQAAKAQTEPHSLTLIALFCGVGLVVALIMASMGFDPGAEFF